MLKRISKFIGLLLTGIILSTAFSGCEADYSNSLFYTMGRGELKAETISEIEIDWEAGNVNFYPCEGSNLYFFEESAVPLDANTTIHYFFDGITLHIRSYKGGSIIKNLPTKTLNVYVPTSYVPKTVVVNTVSADVSFQNIPVKALNFTTVSGTLDYNGNLINSIYFESVSGNINVSTPTATPIIGGKTVSGNATFLLPADTKFTASIDSVTGKFVSNFDTIFTGTLYVHEGTDSIIQLRSTSGSLFVLKRE